MYHVFLMKYKQIYAVDRNGEGANFTQFSMFITRFKFVQVQSTAEVANAIVSDLEPESLSQKIGQHLLLGMT